MLLQVDPLLVVEEYLKDRLGSGAWIPEAADQLARKYFSAEALRRQLTLRRDVFAAIEGFLLAHWDDDDISLATQRATDLAEQTLAFHLASQQQRVQLTSIFSALAKNIAVRVPDPARRKVFGKTLYGLAGAQALEDWVAEHMDAMAATETEEELLVVTWDGIASRIENPTFVKWQPPETMEALVSAWIHGESFAGIFDMMVTAGARIGTGKHPRAPKVDHIVELGEGAFGFGGALALGGIIEITEFREPGMRGLRTLLQRLQKRLKYGLQSESAVLLFEAGFADRGLATELSTLIGDASSRSAAVDALREKEDAARAIVLEYPSYFIRAFERAIAE